MGRWIRVDARGNKKGVDAQFTIEEEQLAFVIREDMGGIDCPIVFSRPNVGVVKALEESKTCQELSKNLPGNL